MTRAGGTAPDELGDDLAVAERLDRRDAADPVLARDLLVRVDVDLRERDALLGRLLLEHRPEHLARPAPVGPEVDDDGLTLRALDHFLLEGLIGDVHALILPARPR